MMTYQTTLRLGAFAGTIILLVVLESLILYRPQTLGKIRRWGTHLLLTFLNTLLLHLVFPILAVGGAVLAQQKGWGLLNLEALDALPSWAAWMLGLLAFDFVVYLQHVLTHRIPWLWRLHRVHHSDPELDASSALRFHPLEILLSMGIKWGFVLCLGPPPTALLVGEILLNSGALFSHANIRLAPWLEKSLRTVVVTPDMHRVHHSAYPRETNSNYGFFFSFWDRLCATYCSQPQKGHIAMQIGLEHFRSPKDSRLRTLCIQPWRKISS